MKECVCERLCHFAGFRSPWFAAISDDAMASWTVIGRFNGKAYCDRSGRGCLPRQCYDAAIPIPEPVAIMVSAVLAPRLPIMQSKPGVGSLGALRSTAAPVPRARHPGA